MRTCIYYVAMIVRDLHAHAHIIILCDRRAMFRCVNILSAGWVIVYTQRQLGNLYIDVRAQQRS